MSDDVLFEEAIKICFPDLPQVTIKNCVQAMSGGKSIDEIRTMLGLDPEKPPHQKYKHVKILMVDPGVLIDFLNWCAEPGGDCYRLPVTEEIPEGTRVVAIHYEFERNCLMLRIEHPSFSPVLPGSVIPRCGHVVSYREFRRSATGIANADKS